jgi:hypothetical protein
MSSLIRRLSAAVLAVLGVTLLAACATGEVKGARIGTPDAPGASAPAGLAYVVFMDRSALKPSGLSALRLGAPSVTIGNDGLSRAFRGVQYQLVLIKPDNVRARLESELERPMPSNVSYIVFVAPRTVSSNSTSAQADVDIVIRDEKTRQLIWKGESTIVAGGVENNKLAARGILQAIRESGIQAPVAP